MFKQRFYPNIHTLSICRTVLFSDNVQSEHITTGESIQTTILAEP